jgi:PPM family protein phosphatase
VFEFVKGMFSGKSGDSAKLGISENANTLDGEPTLVKSLSRSTYRAASCQSAGKERSHNEDTLFVFSGYLNGVESPTTFGLYIVADGMGGHQSGEVASQLAVQGTSQYLMDHIFKKFIYKRRSFSDKTIRRYLEDAVEEAQSMIQREVLGGGTTLTLVLGLDNRFFSAHIGDSRLYCIKLNGELSLMTKDHTLVKRLVDLGEITEEEALRHPERNVLYRALGQMDSIHADIDQFSLQIGDRLLICSDGLWGVVEEKQIHDMILKSHDLDRLACDLVQAANEHGGPDNISVILLERIA